MRHVLSPYLLCLCILPVSFATAPFCSADGPADNNPATVRSVPPVGIQVPNAVRKRWTDRADALEAALASIDSIDAKSRAMVAVFPRAIRMTLATDMFYKEQEFAKADQLLDEAERRMQRLQSGERDIELLGLSDTSENKPQTLVGGFRSAIDGSTQPFGIVLPADWEVSKNQPMRLDVWLHGRGETVSEVGFLSQRMTNVGEYSPPGTIVLHPYGRYCNAFKFAGEIDVIEAVACMKELFNIDEARITIRGFSMGGAGCWQLAVHYPNLWAAANPGAGFSETTQFLKVFQNENYVPTDNEQRLLHWYDCPDWTNNLRNVPTVAYSGEIDRQKQAADVMAAAFEDREMHLTHIIGPETAHKIHPESKPVIETFLSGALALGKLKVPTKIDLTTYMLRYHELGPLSIEGLEEHWKETRVQGQLTADAIELSTKNVSRLKLNFDHESPFAADAPVRVKIDASELTMRSGEVATYIRDDASQWKLLEKEPNQELRKKPGLQGPIDDAFMSAFVFVPPDQSLDADGWAEREFSHATGEWVRHFRGDLVVKRPGEITTQMMLDHNLVLFGTPATNTFIAKIVEGLPIQWSDHSIAIGDEKYDAKSHFPILIYPNPMQPERYIVINSGFTYREYAYLNNARQIPMLPDWAIMRVTDGNTTRYPGEILQSGFFDETWQLK